MPSFETPTRTPLNTPNSLGIPNGKNSPWDHWSTPNSILTPQLDNAVQLSGSNSVTPVNNRRKFALLSNKRQQILNITKQLALLVDTGVDIAEAITVICDQIPLGPVRQAWLNIGEDINAGRALSYALNQQRNVLGADYVVSISAGEASGKLAEVLKSTAAKLERDLDLQWSTRSALAYPCVLCVVAFGVVNSLIWFVLPQFEKVFENMNYTPPWITQALLSGARTARAYYWLFGLSAIALVAATIFTWRHPRFAVYRDKLLCCIPIIGKAYRYLATSGFFLLCGNMLRHGVPLLDSLQLCARASFSPTLRSILEETERDVLVGRNLSHSLAKSSFLPAGAAAMITMAEKSGNLDRVMITTGEYFEKEGVQSLQQALKMLEPILIVLMGGLVALVIASVMLPMMDANSAVR
jgi:type II secretory pathway component PulF